MTLPILWYSILLGVEWWKRFRAPAELLYRLKESIEWLYEWTPLLRFCTFWGKEIPRLPAQGRAMASVKAGDWAASSIRLKPAPSCWWSVVHTPTPRAVFPRNPTLWPIQSLNRVYGLVEPVGRLYGSTPVLRTKQGLWTERCQHQNGGDWQVLWPGARANGDHHRGQVDPSHSGHFH